METSVKAAKVSAAPQPNVDAGSIEGEVAAAACRSSSDFVDPMEEFSQRLEDIISLHGSAATLLDRQVEAEVEKTKEEAKDDGTVAMETEVSLITQNLNSSSSPEEKLADVVRKCAELEALRRCDGEKLSLLQQRVSELLEERQRLQAEHRGSIAARGQLEALCRELQGHYSVLREETVQRCREDEENRSEMTSHFQTMLTEIQAQIELHSARNDKLCRENTNLTDKLESLMSQCEQREASLDKINQHRELQSKLTEARLEQANALLAEAEEKHKREKEYLLREAIDKTKKCFAMKEQELTLKKKLTLYAQKFDDFQATLAKSNEIYVRFKNEMEKMSDKMKKMDKESNLWKTRFENCNKALTDMIQERTEKSKEYDLFVLKIQKLEKLCRALQEERKVLYNKIREVRQANANIPLKVFGGSKLNDNTEPSPLLSPVEIQELQEEDPVLTEDMARLREEQAKLQEFADSLLTSANDNEEEDEDIDLEDLVTSAFVQFKTKPEVKEEPVLVAEGQVVDMKAKVAETDVPQPGKDQEVQKPDVPKPETTSTDPHPEAQEAQPQLKVPEVQPNLEIQQQQSAEQEPTPEPERVTDPKPEPVQTPVEDKDVQQVKPEDKIQTQEPSPEAEKVNLPDAAEPKILERGDINPLVPVEDEDEEVQHPSAEPLQVAAEATSTSAPQSEDTAKQAPKKKKKSNKTAS